MGIGVDDVARFERDGFLVVPDLLAESRVRELLAAMDRVYQGEYDDDRRPPPIRKRVVPFGDVSSVHWILNARWLDRVLWNHAVDPVVGGVAAKLLGTASVSVVEDQLLDKPVGGRPVNMHQDYGYWAFSRSTRMLTCWIALVDMEPALGPLEIVRGSHRWGQGDKPRDLILGSEAHYAAAVERAAPKDATLDVVPVCVPAGGAAFFHALTYHGSQKNRADRPRRAVSLHYAAEECTVDLSKTREHDHPFMFARLTDGGPMVNQYMPRVEPGR